MAFTSILTSILIIRTCMASVVNTPRRHKAPSIRVDVDRTVKLLESQADRHEGGLLDLGNYFEKSTPSPKPIVALSETASGLIGMAPNGIPHWDNLKAAALLLFTSRPRADTFPEEGTLLDGRFGGGGGHRHTAATLHPSPRCSVRHEEGCIDEESDEEQR